MDAAGRLLAALIVFAVFYLVAAGLAYLMFGWDMLSLGWSALQVAGGILIQAFGVLLIVLLLVTGLRVARGLVKSNATTTKERGDARNQSEEDS